MADFDATRMLMEDWSPIPSALALCEALRRENRGFDTTAKGAVDLDMGVSLCEMELAMYHLHESLPNGQRQRTIEAIAVLRNALWNLQRWLAERGVRT